MLLLLRHFDKSCAPLSLVFLLCLVSQAAAQESSEETAEGPWQLSLKGSLSATQTSFSNWQEGGVNTLGYSAELKGEAIRRTESWKETHNLRLAFGQIKQGELDFRKSIDVVQYGLVLQNVSASPLNPTVALEFRSQFTSGYNYKKNPFKDGREPPVKVSDYMAPAYFTQSLGLSYDPDSWFSTRLGLGGKHTIVAVEGLGTLYGLEPGRSMRYELGIESHTAIKVDVAENVLWESRLGLFAAFNKPEMPDARWENFLTMKVNTWLNVKIEFVALYDKDVSTKMQYKHISSLGVSIDIL